MQKKYFVKNISHGELPSAEGVKQNILTILKGETILDFPNILTDISTCKSSGKVISIHSPVELHIYDENGNHAGLNEDGEEENNIPDVSYDIIGGEKFAFLPDGVNYKIITKATDTGGYDLKIENSNTEDNITETYSWILIPINTLQANSEIWVEPDYPSYEYVVKVDQNGDGIFENTFQVSYDGTEKAEEATTPSPTMSSPGGSYGGGAPGVVLLQNQAKPEAQTIIEIPQVIETVQEVQKVAINTEIENKK